MIFYWTALLVYTVVVLYSVLFTEIAASSAFVGGLGVGYVYHIVYLEKCKKQQEKIIKLEKTIDDKKS